MSVLKRTTFSPHCIPFFLRNHPAVGNGYKTGHNAMHLLNSQNVPPSFIPSRITVIFADVAGLSLLPFHLSQSSQTLSVSSRGKRKDSKVEMGAMKESLTVCKEEIERLKKRLVDTERYLDDIKKQNRKLADQTRNLGAQNQKLEGELKNTKAEQRDSIELLRIRTAELNGEPEVIKLVEALNGEIKKTATVMAEAFTIEEKRAEAKDGESEEKGKVYARAGEILGDRMAEMLRTSEHHENPILVQMGLQTAMVGYTHWVISSWCFKSPEDERMLSEVYARVRETGKCVILTSSYKITNLQSF